MPYWLDWAKRNRNHPIPKKHVSQLLTAEFIESEIKKGKDPVALSIIKWEKIKSLLIELAKEPLPSSYYLAISEYIGWSTCGLCIKAQYDYIYENGSIKYGSDKCKKCKLAKIDQCTKDGSVYSSIDQLMTKARIGYDEDEDSIIKMLFKYIDSMLGNLSKIRNT